jgi:hypothetical protein
MIVLSPIIKTSPSRNSQNNTEHQTTIDLTTQSQNTQNDSNIMLPRNLSNSFTTSIQEVPDNNNKDLGNHYPGSDT